MNKVECLILSSSIDYSTDMVCVELESLGINYLRINRDSFDALKVEYSLSTEQLLIVQNQKTYLISDNYLHSIYFRAPVFLRSVGKELSLETQVYRTQWNSFLRNLIVFSGKWINHPVDTYRAENKIFQLQVAKKCGFLIPETVMANNADSIENSKLFIAKSLDTALFYENGNEMFCYSEKISGSELKSSELSLAPIIIQSFLSNKTDIRVTVVSGKMFAVSITKEGKPVDGDWRKIQKEELIYNTVNLPNEIETSIRELMTKLNLQFAGIDLAVIDGEYYFIEINPTGEWAWLSNDSDRQIDKSIVSALIN